MTCQKVLPYLDEEGSMPIQFENDRKPSEADLVIRHMVVGVKLPEVCSLALLFSSCVTLGKAFHLCEPQFPHL